MPLVCTVFIITVLEAVLTMATPTPISLRLQSGYQDFHFVHINFYGDTFYTLYSCLTNNQSRSCSADVTGETKHQTDANERRVIFVDAPTISRTARLCSNIFTCSLQSLQQKLVCSRLIEDVTDCSSSQRTQLFQHFNDSSSRTKCVGIQFQAVNESLIFDSNDGFLEACNTSCNISSGLSEQSTQATASSHAYTSTDVTTKHHHGESKNNNDYRHRDKSHIIIAVVVSVVVTVGLVLAAVLFRRNVMGLIRQPNAPYAIEESRPHFDVDSTGVQGGVSGTELEPQKDSGVYDMSTV